MQFQNNLEFAKQLDAKDSLRKYKNEFHFPKVNDKEVIYFTGNSLGLQPKNTQAIVDEVMTDWRELAVEGHFYAKNPWMTYHEKFAEPLAKVVGALPKEVTVMNTLTVNLHMLMVSFYQPTAKRFKILCEAKAFPSDQYMLESQVKFHGFDPKEAIVEVAPREGEHIIRTEDVLAKIEENAEELALVLIGGINYYTGQVMDMKTITKVGHDVGAKVGWDLAHAAGNIKLELHDWDVDFAAWCSYKYMNSGPGNMSGIFVHEKHVENKDLHRFAGWYGHNKERRFLMEPSFDPMPSAEGWIASNPPILAMAPYYTSLEMFDEIGMDALIEKRDQITSYLEFIILEIAKEVGGNFEIITPELPFRGSQLSVLLHGAGRELFNFLMEKGVIVDWREPSVIRLAPVPLYTSYEDMYRFGQILKEGLKKS
ncbi:kynureninase [Aureivirga marina]|uniref:kynureninase n=1 Tax=Aureivirga marina TaxID=1182451 RepID=UPI0018C8FA34|nr:kynureninase [Aureivirga marina]